MGGRYGSRQGCGEEKRRMRQAAIARRDAIAAGERARRSDALCRRLVGLLGQQLREGVCVAAYSALGSEPDLAAFVRAAYGRGCRVFLPCMVMVPEDSSGCPDASGAKVQMVFAEVEQSMFEAHTAPFLLHPARSLTSDDPSLEGLLTVGPDGLDVVVVPLVAFDAQGNRLGYGGGNYDRFLRGVRSDAAVVGVAFAEQQVDAVVCESGDWPLPRIEVA